MCPTKPSLPQLIHQARGVLKKELNSATSGPSGLYVAHDTLGLTGSPAGRSSMPSLLGKDLRRLKTALFPAIGRATCLAAAGTVTSQPWWNDIRVSPPVKVPSKDTTTVVAALSKHVRKLPATLRRSLTWDRGHEMAKHKSFTVDTNVKVATSAIRRAPGSAAPMKIQTAC